MNKLLLVFSLVTVFTACSSKKDYTIDKDKKYEASKTTLEETEKSNPASFIKVVGEKKKNLIGQTVVRGRVFNNAKVAVYKDVMLELCFYSKTSTLLEKDTEVIYETISPGGVATFKSKYFAPKGTDSLAIKVVGAKF